MKKFFQYVGEALVVLFAGVVLSIILLMWMEGCGETYIDAEGFTHLNECSFFGSKDENR